MKTLVKFSLRRRFLNNTSLMVYGTIFLLIGLLMFSDKLIEILIPDFYSQTTISIQGVNVDEFIQGFEEEFVIDENSDLKIFYDTNTYLIESKLPLSTTEKMYLQTMIVMYEKREDVPYTIEYKSKEEVKVNEDSLYVVITSIYFMVLSFATMASSEVVEEKKSHILETLGSIIGIKAHFNTKLILGWLMLWMQIIFILVSIVIFGSMRWIYDAGEGVLDVLYRLNLLSQKYDTFKVLLTNLTLDLPTITRFSISIVFLLIGVGVIQILMVSIAAKINSSEEASALYTPIQILFMFIYYLSIFLNNPEQMSKGWGFYLSFVPIFSMLLMPLRILTYEIMYIEVMTSLCISISTLFLLYVWGYSFYNKHIFEYNSKDKSRLRNV